MWEEIEGYTRDMARDILRIGMTVVEKPSDYRLFDRLEVHFPPAKHVEEELADFLDGGELLTGCYYVIRTSLKLIVTVVPVALKNGRRRYLFLGPYLPEEFSERMLEEVRGRRRVSAGVMDALRAFYTTVPTAWESHVEAVAAAVVRSGQGASSGREATSGRDIGEQGATSGRDIGGHGATSGRDIGGQGATSGRDIGGQGAGSGQGIGEQEIREPVRVERELAFHTGFVEKAGPTESFYAASQVLEQRYQEENRMLDAIRRGDEELAVKMGSEWTGWNILPRPKDTVRGWKDLLLSGNTICRKAAEEGDVHPVYLDQLSRLFAMKIEACSSLRQLEAIQKDMVRQYCQLVKRYSLSKYSVPVREAMNYVSLNLTEDLTLSAVAKRLHLAPAYLSGLFKKEYGAPLTEYIHEKRCAHAARILAESDVPVSEAAAMAGFTDASYFSCLFKRLYKMTPTSYRMKHRRAGGS